MTDVTGTEPVIGIVSREVSLGKAGVPDVCAVSVGAGSWPDELFAVALGLRSLNFWGGRMSEGTFECL